jgi:rRNA maturation RNase YbeY
MAKQETIHFFKESVRFRLNKQKELRTWLKSCARKEGFKIHTLNYIFCNDAYLLEMNKEYLGHNYFTDIITFDNSVEKKIILGDVFISVDTVEKNSKRFETTFDEELHRVMVHGLLHLLGYKDKSKADRSEMKKKEDQYLALL